VIGVNIGVTPFQPCTRERDFAEWEAEWDWSG